MKITLYNTLSRKKELFEPQKRGSVSMYNCGPTVYDTPHLGNYRTFVMNDLIRRTLEYNGHKVDQAMNITDVDDKTIRRSGEAGIRLTELTGKYEKLFLEGLKSLNILAPHRLLRATEHIETMIRLISVLLEKGTAYRAADGVYVSIDGIKNYGELAGLKSPSVLTASTSRERVANDEYDKDNPRDFAVWKFRTESDGEASWETPFGAGRPGWHIECSAMAMEALGESIDIHTGGIDLIFPHHVNEIAQSESATGKTFARYWMHGAFISVGEDKMAKSLGNIVKLEDLADESVSPIGYRYWLLTAHYRSPVNFTYEAVRGAQNALIRLMGLVSGYPEGGAPSEVHVGRFNEAINNDIDMPKAVALAWDLVKDPTLAPGDKRATLLNFDRVFGLGLADMPKNVETIIPAEVTALAEAREEARLNKDWKKADTFRVEIEKMGYEVSDTAGGGFKISKNRDSTEKEGGI